MTTTATGQPADRRTPTITDEEFGWVRANLELTLHGRRWNSAAITAMTDAVDSVRGQIVGTPA